MKDLVKILFFKKYGKEPEIEKIMGSGSARNYFRLKYDIISVVGVESPDIVENETFLRLDTCLESQGIKVPEVLAVSEDKKAYLLEDLGDISLLQLLHGKEKMRMAEKALKELIRIQTIPEHIWINEVGYSPFSERLVRWDLNYFKYDFLKPAGIIFDEEKLENDFDALSSCLLNKEMVTGFMYRDFQSRNIMVKGEELWFIDFQGARKGPLSYDAASFIWQAKAPFTFEERFFLCDFYSNELANAINFSQEKIYKQLLTMIIFRSLQVLGAYGFRGLIEGKKHFIESIPLAINNLNYLREKGILSSYPEIERISKSLLASNQNFIFSTLDQENKEKDVAMGLTLSVFSFSYKRGYPEDQSGNGGGFMFDCRGLHNPGRYDEYKKKTGKDVEVIAFLEKTSSAKEFVAHALNIVKPSIDVYLARGFTSLQVGFGCTGGQHRSVYCAESFAKLVKEIYPDLRVVVKHRERNFWPNYPLCN